MSRGRRLASATAIALLASACAAPGFYEPPLGGAAAPGSSSTPTSVGRTAWENATHGIGRDGTVTLQTALQAFSVAYRPLPGVEMPKGDPSFFGSGTGPVRWLLGHWEELTSEQQAAARPFFDPNTPPPAAARGAVAAAGPGGQLQPGGGVVNGVSLDVFKSLAADLKPRIEAKLPKGRKLKLPYDVVFRDLPVEEGRVVFAQTIPIDQDGNPAIRSSSREKSCLIQINTRGQQLEDAEDQTAVMAHELFHCFQYELAPRIGDVFGIPPWIDEGGAAWVGEDFTFTELGSTLGQQFWLGWLKEPDWFLFARNYDAIGFYAHLAVSGVDPWKVLDGMYSSAVRTQSGLDAYLLATKGADKAIDTWGPSYIRVESMGADWNSQGKGLPKQIKTPVPEGPLESGETIIMTIDPLTGWAIKLDIRADVFVLVGPSARGMLRLANGTSFTLSEVLGEPFCTKPGGCTCPDGSAGSAFTFKSAPAGVTLFGFSGHIDGLDIDIQGLSAPDTCEKEPGDFQVPEQCYCAGSLVDRRA